MTDAKTSARWRELTDYLRSDLADGHYQPGQALPGEAHLADQYATSRPTIRKAIAQLVNEGLLTVAHGRGTFVRPRPDRRLIVIGDGPHPDLLSPDYAMAAAGWEPITVPSDANRGPSFGHRTPIPTPCGLDEAETLGIRRGTTVIYRYAFWQHVKTRARIYLDSNISADLVGAMEGERLDRHFRAAVEPQEYYRHLADTRGPLRWSTTVQARMPSGNTIEDLAMEPAGTPLLAIRRIMYAADGRPLEYTEIAAPADRFEAISAYEQETATNHGDYLALRV